MYDLNGLLNEVFEKYDTPQGYQRPTIEWSSENMKIAFGRYDYWVNNITINRLLDTDKISKEAILSVIYHELWHQEVTDHGDDFQKELMAFSNYKGLEKVLNRFLKSQVKLMDEPRTIKNKIDFKQAICCVVPYGDEEDYLENFQFYNHYFYVDLGEKRYFDKKYTEIINPPVIWLAKNKTKFYVFGWSVENQIFEQQQSIRHGIFGGDDLDYQIKTRNKNFYMLPANNCKCTILKSKLPKNFEEQGICHVNEIADVAVQGVINFIETYDSEILLIGLTDEVIEACAPLIEKDTEAIIKKSMENEDDTLRSLCLANLAVKQEPCFETIFNQADALRWASFFDEAAVGFEKAQQMEPTNIDAIGFCILVNVILGEFEKAQQYLFLLSDEDVENLENNAIRNSIEVLKNNSVETNP